VNHNTTSGPQPLEWNELESRAKKRVLRTEWKRKLHRRKCLPVSFKPARKSEGQGRCPVGSEGPEKEDSIKSFLGNNGPWVVK